MKPTARQDKPGTPDKQETPTPRTKRAGFRVLSVVLSVAFSLGLIEIGFRIYYRWGGAQGYLMLDETLGWRNAGNVAFKRERKDAAGRSYGCAVQVDANGFREYGDARENTRPKVLVLGDSFTQAYEVSNEDTYYHRLKSALNVEMFAYGCGGYGTLQEYLVLDQWVDRIQPNVLVLQLCYNDFINNCYELELKTPWHNNATRRPYLQEDGTITYALPKTDLPALRSFGHRYSRFVYFIFSRLDRMRLKRELANGSLEPGLAAQGERDSAYRRSVVITDRLFEMLRKRVPRDTKICAFTIDAYPPYLDDFKRLARKHDFMFIEETAEALQQAEQKGQTIRARDKTHLNVLGHQILAQALAGRLSQPR